MAEADVTKRLDDCTTLLRAPVCPGNEEYEDLLLRLYNATLREGGPVEESALALDFVDVGDDEAAAAPHRSSASGRGWERLGFQAKQPDREFRGAGMLALHCLVYIAERHHTDVVSAFLADANGEDDAGGDGGAPPTSPPLPFPFAATSINMTLAVAKMLGITAESTPPAASGFSLGGALGFGGSGSGGTDSGSVTSDEPGGDAVRRRRSACATLLETRVGFYELHSAALAMFVRVARETKAGCFDFAGCFDAACDEFDALLAHAPTSAHDLWSLVRAMPARKAGFLAITSGGGGGSARSGGGSFSGGLLGSLSPFGSASSRATERSWVVLSCGRLRWCVCCLLDVARQ